MNKAFPLLILGLLSLACGRQAVDPGPVATIHPLAVIAGSVADTEVYTLLPPGVSPHAYDPLPSAVRMASAASQIIAVHPEIDGWATALAESPVHWMVPEGGDPHGWLDPRVVRDALPALGVLLCPEATCSARVDSMHAGLNDLLLEGRSRLEGRPVVLSSNFLTAFASAFGLEVVSIVAPVEGVEPSPSALQASISAAREAGLVVGQTRLPEHAARRVAEAAGVPFVAIDPIGTMETAPTYATLIETIVAAIAEAR